MSKLVNIINLLHTFILSLCIVLSVFLSNCYAQKSPDELITNGEFDTKHNHPSMPSIEEKDRKQHGDFWSTYQHIKGWQADSGRIEVQTFRNDHSNNLIELDAGDTTNTNSTISQKLGTPEQGIYTLSFFVKARQGKPTASSGFKVLIDDKVFYTNHSPSYTGSFVTRNLYIHKGFVKISFQAIGPADGIGAYLDKVSLKPSKSKNILVNSDFNTNHNLKKIPVNHEENRIQHGDFWSTYKSIKGWRAIVGRIEAQTFRNQGSNNLIELDSGDTPTTNAKVIQEVFIADDHFHTCDLLFSIKARKGKPASSSAFKVLHNNVEVYRDNAPSFEMHHIKTNIILSPGKNTISFQALGTQDGIGAYLDEATCELTSAPKKKTRKRAKGRSGSD